ncbi:MAG: Oligopeptide transport ATP-binding protein AppD, partial [Microbacterium sp.]|uniref:ABC transporter ATP-binding protein n=1 Tax=Microbacterium sp. TaxID=51671 RepID=UPI002638B74B
MSYPLLSIEDLRLTARTGAGDIPLVHGASLTVDRGERVALVGESGSGKSVTARAILRLDEGIAATGAIRLEGEDLIDLSERAMRRVRGRRIGMVFQDPMNSLDPLRRIGEHLTPLFRARGLNPRQARSETVKLLHELGVPDPGLRAISYPHEFSGGMRQRVVIAMALAGGPDLLIADEPTTALDVRVQRQVLQVLSDAAAARGLAVLFITHDVGVVAGFADRVAVMYRGRIVEIAPVSTFFREA